MRGWRHCRGRRPRPGPPRVGRPMRREHGVAGTLGNHDRGASARSPLNALHQIRRSVPTEFDRLITKPSTPADSDGRSKPLRPKRPTETGDGARGQGSIINVVSIASGVTAVGVTPLHLRLGRHERQRPGSYRERLHGRNGRRPWVKDGKRLDECSSKLGGGTAKDTANPACAEGPNALSQAPRSVRSGSGAALRPSKLPWS
jgi:hypothetical protein